MRYNNTNQKKHRILLVDDELDILEFVSYNLRNEGYIVDVANNGIEGISKAKDSIPDLVLLDVMMPRMDGMETCEELRKIRELDNTIIVFLTARGEDYSQIAGFDAGGDDYIVKPIKPKVLISRIKALIRRRDRTNNSAEKQESVIIEQDDI
ncbi:MAG: response regulator transcription factor, partial [Bacteroidales bacterium]|nr:response regulator transcription factor [Bacteroidales bacterium]